MAESTAIKDAPQEGFTLRDNSALFHVKHEDMKDYQQIKNNGSNNTADMHHVELFDSTKDNTNKAGDSFPSISKPIVALDHNDPKEIGGMVDHAFYTNNSKGYERATKNLSDLASKHFENQPLTAESLQKYENDINANVKADGKGVDFELKDGKIVTHVSESLSKAQLVQAIKDGVDPKSLRLDTQYGTMRDMAAPVTADAPNQKVKNERPALNVAGDETDAPGQKVTNERPAFEMEGHVLKSTDGKLINSMVERQAKDHDLSPEQQQKLEQALTLVAGSDSKGNMQKLGEMTDDIFVDRGLRDSFQDSLEQMGYQVDIQNRGPDSRAMDAAKDWAITLTEPNSSNIGGRKIVMNYKREAGIHGQSSSSAEKYHLRSL